MIVLFFDRIFTGAPNITGSFCLDMRAPHALTGVFYYGGDAFTGYESRWHSPYAFMDSSRVSKEYKSVTEIRVKSIISNGYIKLF